MDVIIEDELKKRNIYLNKSKQQSIWKMHGPGAMKMKALLYTQEAHGIGSHLRYLGPQLEENGGCAVEVGMRIKEAQTAWDHYRSFWSKSTRLETKQIIFKNMVLSTLISGMISLNCTNADEMRLHRKMMALARRSLAGKATIRSEQDGEHMVKKTEREILRMLRIGTFPVELNIARLQFWQRIFRAPDYHQQVITAMFGKFPFDKDGEDFRKHSRFVELQKGLDLMQHYDSLNDLWIDLGDPVQLLFDEKLRERFTQADFKIMRISLWSVAIPPTSMSEDAKIEVDVQNDDVGEFQCMMKLKNEEYCGRRFRSQKALDVHMMKSDQHEIPKGISPQMIVKSNQCPWCERIFKNRNAAKAHAYRSFRDEGCQQQKLKDKELFMRGKRVTSDDNFKCVYCNKEFDSLKDYHRHTRTHGSPGSKLSYTLSELQQDVVWKPKVGPEKACNGRQSTRQAAKGLGSTRSRLKRAASHDSSGEAGTKNISPSGRPPCDDPPLLHVGQVTTVDRANAAGTSTTCCGSAAGTGGRKVEDGSNTGGDLASNDQSHAPSNKRHKAGWNEHRRFPTSAKNFERIRRVRSILHERRNEEDWKRGDALTTQTCFSTREDQAGSHDDAKLPERLIVDKHCLSAFNLGRRIHSEGSRTQGRSREEDPKLVGCDSAKSKTARLNLRPDEEKILLSDCKRTRTRL